MAAFLLTSTVVAHTHGDELAIVRVKKDSALTRYRLVGDDAAAAPSCPPERRACLHRIVPGHYRLEVLPDRDAPGYRTSFTATGETAIRIHHGSKTARYVGITMMIVGGVAAVGGFFAYTTHAWAGGDTVPSRTNPAATAWSIVAGSGLVVTLGGVLTFVSGGTTVSIVHKF